MHRYGIWTAGGKFFTGSVSVDKEMGTTRLEKLKRLTGCRPEHAYGELRDGYEKKDRQAILSIS